MIKKFCHLSFVICHLSSGFTLIEMLVTIAIIAIASGAIIIGINPAKRIQDAQDSKAKQDVRATASAVEACLAYVDPTTQINNGSAASTNCGSPALLASTTPPPPGGPFTRSAPPVTFYAGSASNVCFYELGSTSPTNYWYYSTGVGKVLNQATAPTTCP